MKKLCRLTIFFTPLFCCLFLQGCNTSHERTVNTTAPSMFTVTPSTVNTPKDTETPISSEAPSKSKQASDQEKDDTLNDILDQLDELDSILDGY